jgi:2-iminobutanoate/2-iminopropanoate deaminase
MLKRINVEASPRLPFFSHAVVAGDFIYVSGTLGMKPGRLELVEGGIGPETVQALKHVEGILAACGAALSDVVRMEIYLANLEDFAEMNAAYAQIVGDTPPARITVGKVGLNFGAAIEIVCTAYKPAG